jgi:hypothetical protein
MSRKTILDWAFTVIGTDNLKQLQDEGHADAAIIRTCEGYGIDDELSDHNGDGQPDHVVSRQIEAFYQVDMPFALYQYAHAGLDALRQVNYFLTRSVQYWPGALIGDYEAYINYFVTPQRNYTPGELAAGFAAHSDALAGRAVLPTLNYSGPWVTEHSSFLPEIWAKRWFWGASYLYDWDPKRPSLWPTTWDAWRRRIAAAEFPMDSLYPTWGLWQLGGDVIPPGIGHKVDVSICDNDALFNGIFKRGVMPAIPTNPPPLPTTSTPYRVTATVLTVRKGPGTQYAKAPWTEWRYANQVIQVYDTWQGWARLADKGSEQRWVGLGGCVKI